MRLAMKALVMCISISLSLNALSETLRASFTGTGSGSLAGTSFSNKAFSISGNFDSTAARQTLDALQNNEPIAGNLNTDFSNVVIFIETVGTFQIAQGQGVYLYVDNSTGSVGFGVGYDTSLSDPLGGAGDLYGGGFDFHDNGGKLFTETWNLDRPFGPYSYDEWELLQWSVGVDTSGGELIFNDETGITGSFKAESPEATPVPAVNPIALAAMAALIALLGVYWRRRPSVS